jgi:hypothetical protein
LKTPSRVPKANAFCERLVGTIRRECQDYLIPINKRHLQRILKEFIRYYNCEKIHSGPGLPEENRPGLRSSGNRHRLPNTSQSTKKPVAGEVAPRLSLGIGSCVAEAPSLLRSTGANTEDRRARESDPVSPLRRTVFVELSPRLSPIILLG